MPEYYSGRIILSPSESTEFCEMISHPSSTVASRRDSHLEKIRSEMEIVPTATGFTLSIPDAPDPKAVVLESDCATDNYILSSVPGLYQSFPRKIVQDTASFESICKLISAHMNFDYSGTYKYEFSMRYQKRGTSAYKSLYNLSGNAA